jgi:hypothetical protein
MSTSKLSAGTSLARLAVHVDEHGKEELDRVGLGTGPEVLAAGTHESSSRLFGVHRTG